MILRNITSITQLLKNASNEYQLYVDHDGVLADFNAEFEKFGQGTPEEYNKTHGKESLYNLINENTDHFWLDMKWMPDGKELWDFVKDMNPTILTTPAETVKNCVEDKEIWMERELGDIDVIMSIDKYEYAHPKAILIDDRAKNIDPWVKAGGIGILHTSAKTSIQELKKYLDKNK